MSKGFEVPVYTHPRQTDFSSENRVDESSARRQRAEAYRLEADPLFFKWQRGEATEQEWLDKVQQIRERYPYPENNEGAK